MKYTIKYTAQNTYESPVKEALWQFLILPEDNATQDLEYQEFTNSLNVPVQQSINGLGFTTYRIHSAKKLNVIDFEANFSLEKKVSNPFSQINERNMEADLQVINSLAFKVDHEPYLKSTTLTQLPKDHAGEFKFDSAQTLFENTKKLNTYIFENFSFRADVTGIDTDLSEILKERHGVCQDFTHLFCALSRKQKIPARYVSGYLHQGHGYLGDSQMHAWAECYLPGLGWMGFDPTNNLVAAENHIKVAHGKDYSDCPPIKGLVYTSGTNSTTYTVEVREDEGGMSQDQIEKGMSQRIGNMVQQMAPLGKIEDKIFQQQ